MWFSCSPGTDSTSVGDVDASPGFTVNDIMASGFPGFGFSGHLELILLLLAQKRHIHVLMEKV